MKILQHHDKLGQELVIGDFVAFPQANGLMIGKIIKLSDKMLIINSVGAKQTRKRVRRYVEVKETFRKYPADAVKLNLDASLTMYLIRNS